MLEYWMASNQSGYNGSDANIEEVLQNPGSVTLFIGYPPWLLHFAAGCCILFMFVGIPGNLITVAALFRTKKLRNATAIFIMNLSLSDLMFCCFNLPLATSTFWHSSWHHGPLLCRLFPLLRYGLVAVSLFTILAITINRYIMVGHPKVYPTFYKRKYLIPMVLATWLIAFGILIVTWFGKWGRFGLDPHIGSCSILPDIKGRNPKEFLFVFAFLTPCIAIVVCYARIFYIVRKTAKKSKGRRRISMKKNSIERNSKKQLSSHGNQKKELGAVQLNDTVPVLCNNYSQDQALPTRPIEERVSQISSKFADEETSSENPSSWEQESSKESTDQEDNSNDSSDSEGEGKSWNSSGEIKSTVDKFVKNNDRDTKVESEKVINSAAIADDRQHAEIKNINFLNGEEKDAKEKSTMTAREKLEKMASHASFIVESTLWVQGVTGNDRLKQSKTFASPRADSSERMVKMQSKTISNQNQRNSKLRAEKSKSINTSKMSAKDKKLLKMILAIFCSFLICYLPITLTKIFKDAIDWRGLNIAGYILIYLTTCINPVIYVVMSSEYRNAYKNLLLCKRHSTMKRSKRLRGRKVLS